VKKVRTREETGLVYFLCGLVNQFNRRSKDEDHREVLVYWSFNPLVIAVSDIGRAGAGNRLAELREERSKLEELYDALYEWDDPNLIIIEDKDGKLWPQSRSQFGRVLTNLYYYSCIEQGKDVDKAELERLVRYYIQQDQVYKKIVRNMMERVEKSRRELDREIDILTAGGKPPDPEDISKEDIKKEQEELAAGKKALEEDINIKAKEWYEAAKQAGGRYFDYIEHNRRALQGTASAVKSKAELEVAKKHVDCFDKAHKQSLKVKNFNLKEALGKCNEKLYKALQELK